MQRWDKTTATPGIKFTDNVHTITNDARSNHAGNWQTVAGEVVYKVILFLYLLSSVYVFSVLLFFFKTPKHVVTKTTKNKKKSKEGIERFSVRINAIKPCGNSWGLISFCLCMFVCVCVCNLHIFYFEKLGCCEKYNECILLKKIRKLLKNK